MAVNVPAELGGAGAGTVAYALAMQEVARACASTAVMMSVTNMVGETIAHFGTAAQKRSLLPDPRARRAAAWAASRSASPTRAAIRARMTTTARRDGSDWVLDGSKQWITGGSAAAVFIVWARTAAPTASGGIQTAASRASSSRGARPGCRSGGAEDKMGSAARTRCRSSSTTAAFRRTRCSARRTTASRSR